MSAFSCERATQLWDRAAVGESVDAGELSRVREHAARCASCAAEARFYDVLARGLDEDGALFDCPPFDTEKLGPRLARAKLRLGLAATAFAASAAAGTLWWFSRPSEQPTNAGAPVAGEVVRALAAGEVELAGARAAAGAVVTPAGELRVGRGRACLSYAWGATVCAGAGSTLRLLAGPGALLGVELERGSIVCRLDAKPPGARFSVETPQGRVTATGTVFSVEHMPGGDELAVRLHRGSIEVAPRVGEARELRAPVAVVLGDGVRPVRAQETAWKSDSALIEAAELWSAGALVPFDVAPSPPGALVSLDGFALGEAPISTLIGRGEHELTAERAGFVPHRERISVLAERVRRSPALLPVPAAIEPEPESDTGPVPSLASAPGPSPAELLARARGLRSAGRYADAASAYQSLISARPASAEARVALVSLGELQLSQLKNPDAALRSFDAYLRREGTLAQEARYGRIRALRALGRHGEASQAARQFIERYPGSPQARQLEQPSQP